MPTASRPTAHAASAHHGEVEGVVGRRHEGLAGGFERQREGLVDQHVAPQPRQPVGVLRDGEEDPGGVAQQAHDDGDELADVLARVDQP